MKKLDKLETIKQEKLVLLSWGSNTSHWIDWQWFIRMSARFEFKLGSNLNSCNKKNILLYDIYWLLYKSLIVS